MELLFASLFFEDLFKRDFKSVSKNLWSTQADCDESLE